MLNRLLAGLVDTSRRHALLVLLAGFLLAVVSCVVAATRLGVSTDTDQMFSDIAALAANAIEMNKDFPQFRDLLVAVIDANEPEEADATAAALARRSARITRISAPSGGPTPRRISTRTGCCSSICRN